MLYVIHYDRQKAKTVDIFPFEKHQREWAYQKRRELEIAHNSLGNREIVLIEANDEAQLRKTHAKYFDKPLTEGEIAFTALLVAAGVAFFAK